MYFLGRFAATSLCFVLAVMVKYTVWIEIPKFEEKGVRLFTRASIFIINISMDALYKPNNFRL